MADSWVQHAPGRPLGRLRWPLTEPRLHETRLALSRRTESPYISAGSRGEQECPALAAGHAAMYRSEEHTSELQSHSDLVCRLLLEKKNKKQHKRQKYKLNPCDS